MRSISKKRDGSNLRTAAATLSLFKKHEYLLTFTEAEFRDRVIRPLFLRLGFTDGRDVCGTDEEGKDAVFLSSDPLGGKDVTVVQTKKGNLNLTSKARDNLINAIAQLRTAEATAVVFVADKTKRYPSKVYLCASGKINNAARKYIAEDLKSSNLRFLDGDEIIPQIDQHYAELWLNIDADLLPYMRELQRSIEDAGDHALAEIMTGTAAAATDAMFVDLYLNRIVPKVRSRKGKPEVVPELLELPVTAILKKSERLVLISGDAGAGKSTAIRRVAYVLAKRASSKSGKPLIPVLLRATEIARQRDVALIDIAMKETQVVAHSANCAFGSEDLTEGRVVVLIDALDEVPDEQDRRSALDRVRTFHAANPKCLVIVTSREHALLKNLDELAEFARYRVQQISFRQAEQLVRRLERKGRLPLASAKEVMRRLEGIHGLDLSPLLVAVFAATTEYSRQDIPANITELFKKFTEMMLGRWDTKKGFAQQFHSQVKDFILTRVAYAMHVQKVTALDVEQFRSAVSSELKSRGHEANIDQFLDEILNRSGLLRVIDGRVEFRHLLIQEFFAGRGIPSEDQLEQFVFDEWWQRAVVFYCGDHPENNAGLARIQKVADGRGAAERFTAASTLGLALQAAYLIPVTDKVDGIIEVIRRLAAVKEEVVLQMPGANRFPLMGFITYYLLGRDSVAFSLLEQHGDAILARLDGIASSPEEKQARQFWLIAGLVEAGKITQAEKLVRTFHPTDKRLLLGLHLGAFYVEHLRVVGGEQKKSARRISERLNPVVAAMREQIFNELKSHLLEVRKGLVVAVPERPGKGTDE